MGVRTTEGENVVAIFDSVSGFAFGPTFPDVDAAEAFLEFARREGGMDVRGLSDGDLERLHSEFSKTYDPDAEKAF